MLHRYIPLFDSCNSNWHNLISQLNLGIPIQLSSRLPTSTNLFLTLGHTLIQVPEVYEIFECGWNSRGSSKSSKRSEQMKAISMSFIPNSDTEGQMFLK